MSKGAPGAGRSAAALAGFLVVAGAQLAAVLLALWAVLSLLPGSLALRVGVPLSLATFGTLSYATWHALHTRHRTPGGVAVGREQAPRLWAMIDGAAQAAGVGAPAGVTVVADATVALGERTRLLGLIGGRRDLYLGLPLLQALEPDRLTAVVTHELAHGSAALGRWAPLAHRGRVVIGRTMPRISRRGPAGIVLRAYAGFYRRVDAPFSRAQELAADRLAARHAGVEATIAALRDLPALAGMQRLFHAEYVGPGWQAGFVPDDVFGGLLRVLAARSTEMAMLRARDPELSGPWDTHPPLGERIAALQALLPAAPASDPAAGAAADPSAASSPAGSSLSDSPAAASSAAVSSPAAAAPAAAPAAAAPSPGAGAVSSASAAGSGSDSGEPVDELVPDLPALGRALQDVAFPPRGRSVVSWDECLSVARTSEMEREAEAALASISRAVGSPVHDAGQLLSLAADGRLRTAAETLFPEASPEETMSRIVELLGLMLALAALRSGVARWRHSWTGAAEVAAADGTNLDLAELASAAADPETTEAVRVYLTEAGVDLAAAASRPGAARAQVLGGLINLSADGARTDVLITDLGLLLVPGLPRGRGPESKRRLTRIAADGVPAGGAAASIGAAAAPAGEPAMIPASDALVMPDGGRFVPFADVAGVATLPGRRKGWTLGMRAGGELSLRPALDTDELPGGWAAWEEAVAFLAGTR
ncbi:M48 family metalloprotease [Actinoplanes subglobosus]|uniref:M48 family metalloprotease n=1 Tax=Actinoplanes subglobosus TaxID=1547892 RepID=A0ABV8J9H1_9ACTN